jgi:hypothetical protein
MNRYEYDLQKGYFHDMPKRYFTILPPLLAYFTLCFSFGEIIIRLYFENDRAIE